MVSFNLLVKAMLCISTRYMALKLHEHHGDKDFSVSLLSQKKSPVSWSGSRSDTNAGIDFSL